MSGGIPYARLLVGFPDQRKGTEMKELTVEQAERLAGQRLDRRRRYATTDDGQPDGSYGGAVLFSLFRYTTSCSGCTPSYEEAGGIVDCGGGCHECGYIGRRRHTEWGDARCAAQRLT